MHRIRDRPVKQKQQKRVNFVFIQLTCVQKKNEQSEFSPEKLNQPFLLLEGR